MVVINILHNAHNNIAGMSKLKKMTGASFCELNFISWVSSVENDSVTYVVYAAKFYVAIIIK